MGGGGGESGRYSFRVQNYCMGRGGSVKGGGFSALFGGVLPALPGWGKPGGARSGQGDAFGDRAGASIPVLEEPGRGDGTAPPGPPLPSPIAGQKEAVAAKRKKSHFAAFVIPSPPNSEIQNFPKGKRLGRGQESLQGSRARAGGSTTLCSQQRISVGDHPLPCWGAATHSPSAGGRGAFSLPCSWVGEGSCPQVACMGPMGGTEPPVPLHLTCPHGLFLPHPT